MLNDFTGLTDLENLNLTPKIILGDKVNQLCRAKNIDIKCKACDSNELLELMLYTRSNIGRFEAGLILLPGPCFPKDKVFPKEMLRFFGMNHELCLITVAKIYGKLIDSHNLREMK